VANQDDELEEAASVAPEDLSDELVKKWDPERLLRMVAQRAGKGEQLDHSLRQRYEKRFGVDLSHVRLYTGEFAEEFAKRHDAYAVTVGDTGMILMGGSPEKGATSAAGEALLAHELTHVAQAEKHLAAAARAPGMAFAEEHEAEAEQVEQEVADGGGGGPSGADKALADAQEKNADQLRAQVMARVLDMLAEAGRVGADRNGRASRRP
jgi:hypothetical protein